MRQVVAGLCEASVFVPVETVTSNGNGVSIVGVIHCQMQSHDTVTACRIGEGMRQVIAGLREARVFVPV